MDLGFYFHALGRLISTIEFPLKLMKRENLKNPFSNIKLKESDNKEILILANGPSMKKSLSEILSVKDKYDTFVINDFIRDERIHELKPKYYALSDPYYFRDSFKTEYIKEIMYKIASEINWDCFLFIPYIFQNSHYLDEIKQNPHIKIIIVHYYAYHGMERFRNFFWSKGYGNGELGTVALSQIYCSLLMGYRKLYVFGIDHTFFDNLAMNENNELCSVVSHFYDNEPKLEVLRFTSDNDNPHTMLTFLSDKLSIFNGHHLMKRLADYMGAEIINCTPGSLVDAYPRKK